MEVFDNQFFKNIAIPIALAIASVWLEIVSKLVKGRSRGEYKYRVWIDQSPSGDKSVISPLQNQSLQQILNQLRPRVVEINRMISFDIAEFNSLPINLIVGAFAIDISSLVNHVNDSAVTGVVLLSHFSLLIVIVIFVMLSEMSSPQWQWYKRTMTIFAIIFGIVAMIIAFYAA